MLDTAQLGQPIELYRKHFLNITLWANQRNFRNLERSREGAVINDAIWGKNTSLEVDVDF